MTECLKKKAFKDLFSQVSSFPLFFYVPLVLHSLWPIHKRIIKKAPFYATTYQNVCIKQVMHIFYAQNSKWLLIFLFSQLSRLGSQFSKSKISSMYLFHEVRDCVYLIHCLIPEPKMSSGTQQDINKCLKNHLSSLIYHHSIPETDTPATLIA